MLLYNNKRLLMRHQEPLKYLGYLAKCLDLNRHNRTGLKHKLNPLRQVQERISSRGAVTPNSSPPLNLPPLPQSSESQPFPLLVLPHPGIRVGGRLAHRGTMGKINRQQIGPLYRSKRFQDTIWVNSSPVISSDKAESIFLPITSRRDRNSSPEMGS